MLQLTKKVVKPGENGSAITPNLESGNRITGKEREYGTLNQLLMIEN